MKNKFNIGDIVCYIPKLSGFNNKTPLKISSFCFETHGILGEKLDSPVYLYSFEGFSLSAYEYEIKKSNLTECYNVNKGVEFLKLHHTGYFIGDTEVMVHKGKCENRFYYKNYYIANISFMQIHKVNPTEELKRRIEYYTKKNNSNEIDFVNIFITNTYKK